MQVDESGRVIRVTGGSRGHDRRPTNVAARWMMGPPAMASTGMAGRGDLPDVQRTGREVGQIVVGRLDYKYWLGFHSLVKEDCELRPTTNQSVKIFKIKFVKLGRLQNSSI